MNPESEGQPYRPSDETLREISNELERESTLDEKVRDAENFKELRNLLMKEKTIAGSKKEYSGFELANYVSDVEYGREKVGIITNSFGIRQAVLRLLDKRQERIESVLNNISDPDIKKTVSHNVDVLRSKDDLGVSNRMMSAPRGITILRSSAIAENENGTILYVGDSIPNKDRLNFSNDNYSYLRLHILVQDLIGDYKDASLVSDRIEIHDFNGSDKGREVLDLTSELWNAYQ